MSIPGPSSFTSSTKEPFVSRVNVEQATSEHFARIHRAALVLSGNIWDADDLAQETFLVLSRNHEKFRGQSNLYTWLYGVLLNLDRKRREKRGLRRRKMQDMVDRAQSETPSPPADARAEASEWKSSLWSRVAELPTAQHQTLVLRFSQGLRYEDIAEAMDCPLGTVKSRIYHGLNALRQLLDESEDVRFHPEHTSEDENYGISTS